MTEQKIADGTGELFSVRAGEVLPIAAELRQNGEVFDTEANASHSAVAENQRRQMVILALKKMFFSDLLPPVGNDCHTDRRYLAAATAGSADASGVFRLDMPAELTRKLAGEVYKAQVLLAANVVAETTATPDESSVGTEIAVALTPDFQILVL